jgi:hypothetical protein
MPESQIETANLCMVSFAGMGGEPGIMMLYPPIPGRPFTKDQALNLAAWLVAIADHSPDHADFKAVLSAVEST